MLHRLCVYSYGSYRFKKKKEKKKDELRLPFIYCLIYARIECTEYS